MKEYQKIPAIFKRDDKAKMTTEYVSDEIKYLADNQWEFTEKLDGTNVRIHYDGHRIELGGRTDKAQFQGELKEYLESIFLTPEMEELFEQNFGDKDVILFGEGIGYKIQFGDKNVYLPGKEVKFILFDVMINDLYLSKENMRQIGEQLGLETVPIIDSSATLLDACLFVKSHPLSVYAKKSGIEQEMEGLVGTPKVPLCDRRGNRIIVKIKYRDLKDLELC